MCVCVNRLQERISKLQSYLETRFQWKPPAVPTDQVCQCVCVCVYPLLADRVSWTRCAMPCSCIPEQHSLSVPVHMCVCVCRSQLRSYV